MFTGEFTWLRLICGKRNSLVYTRTLGGLISLYCRRLAMSKRGTLGRKGRHWSQKFREVVVAKSSNGSFNVCIEGGAENGEFARIGSFKQDKVKYKHGKLQVNDIILEVSEVAIAGYTLPDVVSLIKKTGDLLEMKVVKPGEFLFKIYTRIISLQSCVDECCKFCFAI